MVEMPRTAAIFGATGLVGSACLELLLADVGETPPQEIKDKVLIALTTLAPTYDGKPAEWEALNTKVRNKLDIDVPELPGEVNAALADIPREFTIAHKFEDIVDGGFFGDYLTYTAESEAPTQFHFGAMLTCASAAFARRPLLGWQAAPLYPNIYTLLIGPTGTRKSTALGKARELVEAAFPKVKGQLARVNVLPNEGSPQGYASALRNRSYEYTGKALSDGLVVASELTVLVGKENYKAALGSWLVDWYDNLKPVWARALKGEEVYELPAPYVCFAGASNMTWLREIPEQLIKAGYMPRHLVFNAQVKRHDCTNPQFDSGLLAKLVARMAECVVDLPETMPLSPAAVQLMDDWYLGKVTRQERGEVDELFAAWLSRKLPHALKVAVVWQVVDGGPHEALHAEWVRRAIRLIDWMDAGVLTVYHALGSTSEGAITGDVLEYIERKGGSVTFAALTRGLRNRYNVRSVKSGVETLALARMLNQTQEAGSGTSLTLTEMGRRK